MPLSTVLAWGGLPGGLELVLVIGVALLIFGRRLPDVARSLGKSIVEFKKGVKDIKDDVEVQSKIESSGTSEPRQLSSDSNDSEGKASQPNEQGKANHS